MRCSRAPNPLVMHPLSGTVNLCAQKRKSDRRCTWLLHISSIAFQLTSARRLLMPPLLGPTLSSKPQPPLLSLLQSQPLFCISWIEEGGEYRRVAEILKNGRVVTRKPPETQFNYSTLEHRVRMQGLFFCVFVASFYETLNERLRRTVM